MHGLVDSQPRPKELKQLWIDVSKVPVWQNVFSAMGLQDEIPPNMVPNIEHDSAPATPSQPPKGPPPLSQPSPPKNSEAPKRVHQTRAAPIGKPKQEESNLKAPGSNPEGEPKKRKARNATQDDDKDCALELDEDAEDPILWILLDLNQSNPNQWTSKNPRSDWQTCSLPFVLAWPLFSDRGHNILFGNRTAEVWDANIMLERANGRRFQSQRWWRLEWEPISQTSGWPGLLLRNSTTGWTMHFVDIPVVKSHFVKEIVWNFWGGSCPSFCFVSLEALYSETLRKF